MPPGGLIWRGDLTEGLLGHRFGGLIFGGAYTWSGLFSEFYGIWRTLLLFKRGSLLGTGVPFLEGPV